MLHRDQALAAGLTPSAVARRVQTGRWERLLPLVYRYGGAPPTFRQQLVAAALWLRRGYAFSHRTAAGLWGFARYESGPIEVSVHRDLRREGRTTVHRVEVFPRGAVEPRDGFPTTSAARTLLDLCATERPHDLRASLDEALRRKWTSVNRLRAELERAGSRPGVALFRDVLQRLEAGEAPTESELEARVLELLEAGGLPRPTTQQRVVIGGKACRLDFRIPGTRVVIEADGYAWHMTPLQFERDRARNNALLARGLRVLHWTWAAVRDRPQALLAELHRALALEAGSRSGGASP